MNKVALNLQKQIADEIYKPGDILPNAAELAVSFKVSDIEVSRAISELIYEGIIERVPDNKDLARVSKSKLIGTIKGNHSFTREAKKMGKEPGVNILTFETRLVWPSVKERLQLDDNDEVIIMERLMLADDEPMALEFSYMPAKFYPGVTREMFESKGEGQSSFKVMQEKFGLKSEKAIDEVTVASLEKREADLLNMDEGVPVLVRFRVTISNTGIPIKGSRAIYKFKAGYELPI